jgi:hypothetical protein
MNRRFRRRSCGSPFLGSIAPLLAFLFAALPLQGGHLTPSIDTVNLPDSIAFPLAEAFINDLRDDCAMPGAIVVTSGDTTRCKHPLNDYVCMRNDSVVIRSGGKAMLAAYRVFRRIDQNKHAYSFSHKKFLSYTEPPKQRSESWISRQVKKLLGRTFMQVFHFLAPHLAELWNSLSSSGKWAVIAVAALLMLLFLAFIARALAHSHFVQRRLAPDVLPAMKAVRKVDWLAHADASLQSGEYRKALSFLYTWFTVWLTQSGVMQRQEWWTNRQLIAAIGRTRPAISSLAQSLIAIYEDTEYGHHAVEADTLYKLRNRIRLELLGGRP